MMRTIFDANSDELLDTVKTAILEDSLAEDISLQEKLENAFFKLKLMDYAFNETMIFAVTDKAGQILFVNDRFVEISGYERQELIGKTHNIVNSNAHPKSFFKEMWSTILSEKTWTGEICNRRKNGDLYWVKTYILPVHMNNKESYFLSIRTDITSEKEKEKLLQLSIVTSFETVVNQVNNLVFKVEKDAFGSFAFSMFTGKIASEYLSKRGNSIIQTPRNGHRVNSTANYKSINALMPLDMANRLTIHLMEVCKGIEVSYNEWMDDKCIHITLSPFMKDGEVVGAVGFGNDITELESTRKKLNELAYFDHLTNTQNTAALERDVREKISYQKPFHFIYVDLDRFKNINDSLGHVTGDKLLQKVTRRLNNFIQARGELYRIGGDEFVILIDEEKTDFSSIQFSESLIREVESPFYIDEMEVYISCSIGISNYPKHGNTYHSLHHSADLALNVSKENGKRSAVLFTEEHREGFVNKVQLESDIRTGLDNNEFFLMYQPKVHLKSGTIEGFEALIRWKKKSGEIVPPNDFIPFSEETGLVIPIGKFVLKEACRQAVEWLKSGVKFNTIAINISPAELEQNDFLTNLQNVLQETGLPPYYLEMEITENVLMKNMDRLTNVLLDIKKLGIKIAMDDFGSGFSNFRYLSELPIHTLKIDQLFMKRILENRDEVIVSSIIRIGQSLGLDVVAEGVENKEVIDFLNVHNCHFVQGYYYSKPMKAKEVPTFTID